MKDLLKAYKGKICTYYRRDVSGDNYGWVGRLVDYDKKLLKIRCTDNSIRLLNRGVLDVIIEGNFAYELEVTIDPSSRKGGKENE